MTSNLLSGQDCWLITRGLDFKSCAWHDKSTIDKEGNENLLSRSTSLDQAHSFVSGCYYARDQVWNAVQPTSDSSSALQSTAHRLFTRTFAGADVRSWSFSCQRSPTKLKNAADEKERKKDALKQVASNNVCWSELVEPVEKAQAKKSSYPNTNTLSPLLSSEPCLLVGVKVKRVKS